MLNSLKVRTRLFILLVFITSALIITSIIAISSIQTLTENLGIVNSDLNPAVTSVQRVETNIARIGRLVVEANFTTDKERIREIEIEITQLTDKNTTVHLPVVKAVLSSGTGLQLYNELITTIEGYLQLRNNFFEVALEGNDTNELFLQVERASEEVMLSIETLVEFVVNGTDAFVTSDLEGGYRTQVMLIVVNIVIIILGIIITILVTNSITKPISILKSKLSQMTSGDLAIEVPTGYKAEFGEMFTNFKEMLGNLNNLIIGAKGLALDVHHSSDNIASALGDVKENVATIDENVNILTTGVENQVANLKENAVAMDNIASGVQQIAESSTSVSELATETSMQANDGSAVIEKSVNQMEIINQVVENTSAVVDRLVKRTKTIDEALKAITAIAEQTNLLALNASIEAARAGEHGRGFAVVAEEVSKLADQSKASASEINVLLQEINEDTKEAVQAMGQGKIESKQGIEVIQQAGQAFSSIVEQVTIMTEQIQEVSSTVEELAAGTEEINASLVDVVQTSEKISEQAKKVTELNESEIAMLDKMYKAVNDTTNNIKNLEEELNEFKTEKKEDMKKE